mgnify:CR=1 FL=1
MVAKRFIIIPIIVSLLLLVPFIAMRFTDNVNWAPFDFVVAGVLLLGAGFTFDFSIRKIKNKTYRILVPIILVLIFLLLWAELAVGILGNPFGGS